MTEHIITYNYHVSRKDREKLLEQKGILLWLTGLSGSGKSTIAAHLEHRLIQEKRYLAYVLDGDNTRTGINKDLSFSPEDRAENIRRVGEIGKVVVDIGAIGISAFISPYQKDREIVRELLGERFIEIYINCPLEICKQRDPKGLYQKAEKGIIKDFTGIDSPYEPPLRPEIEIRTDQMSVDQSVNTIITYLETHKLINHK